MRFFLRLIFSIVVFCSSFFAYSTHIRAGEIIAVRVSTLTYRFTFVGYRDIEGVPFGQGLFNFGDGVFFGDEDDEKIPWEDPVLLGNGVEKWQFTISHTYAGSNSYLVSYEELARNGNIKNITGSDLVSFYVESLVLIDPLISNNTPYFTVPPIDHGVVGAIFEHNPGAYDPDGDSLSYYFTSSKQQRDLDVDGYRPLIHPSFYKNFSTGNKDKNGPPSLTINPANGEIIWNVPGESGIEPLEKGEFNIAFVVEEWREIGGEMLRLGFVTRDMQIFIWNVKNEPPELIIPDDTCVVAQSSIQATITGTDPDGHDVKIEAYGGPFEVLPPNATIDPYPPIFQSPPSTLIFEWEPACSHVRERPYEVEFKITDDPPAPKIEDTFLDPNLNTFRAAHSIHSEFEIPGQVSFETWRISVLGPAPQGLALTKLTGKRLQLMWDSYTCTNADSIQIWRKIDTYELSNICEVGIPQHSEYQIINIVDITTTSYIDTDLSPGAKYCYRLVATFPKPLGGQSISSEEICDVLLIDVPVITHVTVVSTQQNSGEIRINWTPPYEIDTSLFPPNYTYELIRNAKNTLLEQPWTLVTKTTDTFYIDTGLNTAGEVYYYRVVLFDGLNTKVDTSAQASTVELVPQPRVGAINLKWQADVPWSMVVSEHPYHYIYRDQIQERDNLELILIDSVNVTLQGFTYLDNGSVNTTPLNEEIEYCYYVVTQGSYGNDLITSPLINSSQVACAKPNDEEAPCPPASFVFNASLSCENQLETVPCGANLFKNEFTWTYESNEECDNDVAFFNIYFSSTGNDEDFELLTQVETTRYTHSGLSSLAGCYLITVVDQSGNESERSEKKCNDNCATYELPNVFTPNGDGKNDVFRPFQSRNNCPRFVEKVFFNVFDRSGVKLFSYDSQKEGKSIQINWNGRTNAGNELPAGVYFYSANVTFITLKKDKKKDINGWVQIIR